jgi:hypothetical protein
MVSKDRYSLEVSLTLEFAFTTLSFGCGMTLGVLLLAAAFALELSHHGQPW